MKFLGTLFAVLVGDREMRANVRALLKYLAALAAMIAVYAVLFHVIKDQIEGERYSWLTGLYWTLVVMTTLGFGDITFTSDLGRVFSIVVLLSGVLFLLILLPFLFIRLFYAPWLEARLKLQAPRELPDEFAGHVVIVEHDALAVALIARLRAEGTPYVLIEPDPAKAAGYVRDGLVVVTGENDNRRTYEGARAAAARLVVANCEDTVNTNITLTVREVAPDVPIAAIVEGDDAVDVLQLSGATWVLPLKRRLGAWLATRVDMGRASAHTMGRFKDLEIAELPARHTQLVGTTLRDSRLREQRGVSVIGLWQRGQLQPAFPDAVITADSVLVLVGTPEQIASVEDRGHAADAPAPGLTLVIGAGKVGAAAAHALTDTGARVHVIDRTPEVLDSVQGAADATFAGDAADRELLTAAGVHHAASVLLTTNDDAMNIYLAVFCRRLNPTLRIVSRVTHQRNVEAMHRAGADFVLSYTSLGVDAVMSLLEGHEPVILGEGVRLFEVAVPQALAGRTLGESQIGARTGLSVVALERDEQLQGPLTAETRMPYDGQLIMLGSLQQREAFAAAFERQA